MAEREKIAILGGGISGLTTAFELTSRPGWDQRYEITIYQMGWRLGGKGASSRNPEASARIEEHGLHIWIGFYENAFEIIRRCYAELARRPEQPLSSWDQAFKPHDFVVLEEYIDGQWSHLPMRLPENDLVPGDGREFPSLVEYTQMALQWLRDNLALLPELDHLEHVALQPSDVPSKVKEALDVCAEVGARAGADLLDATASVVANLVRDVSQHGAAEHHAVHWSLGEFLRVVRERHGDALMHEASLRHVWIPIELIACTVRGVFADGAVVHGLDVLDDYDFRDWLARHGASQATLDSAWVRGAYDLAFSFVDGDSTRPNVAAGTAVRSMLRMVFAYKGAFLWKMQAGMGETVFTPLYEVLRRRGVRFQFFSRVKELQLNAAGDAIGTVVIGRQATVKQEPYEPLVDLNGTACWRHAPDYDQLVEGRALEAAGVNLESFWTPWADPAEIRLALGKDFDIVVLGIPIAALRSICRPLIATNRRWRDMVEGVRTNQTQGFQVWLDWDLPSCGWPYASPILGAYTEPLDTWADMSHLLPVEGWPVARRPSQLAYFVGVMPDAPDIPGPDDHEFPAREHARARANAIAFLEQNVGYLWPSAADPTTGAFDWSLLHAPEAASGDTRFDAQYWRANIDPSERYTLAVAGSLRYRLRTDESGFRNLYLTGDWIRNGLNTPGCIESATLSGRQTSRAICGFPETIPGETDLP